MQAFKLVVEACAISEFGEGPRFAEIEVNQIFIDLLKRLSKICGENHLQSVTVALSPEWDKSDELRIQNNSLQVWEQEYWFEGNPKHAEYQVETRSLCINMFTKIAVAGMDNPSVPDNRYTWSDGNLFFSVDPEGLDSLIEAYDCQ